MHTTQTNRLAYLMKALRITVKELAEAIYIDPSLISRWRKNTRPILPEHLENITDYILTTYTEKKIFNKLLQQDYPLWEQYSFVQKKKAFKKWLLDDAQETTDSLKQQINVSGEYTTRFVALKGEEGRMRAYRRLLEVALSHPENRELLLYSENPKAIWNLSTEETSDFWQTTIMELLAKGSTVTVIHSLSHPIQALRKILAAWLPIEFKTKLESYYYTGYTKNFMQPTLMIVKDKAAAISLTAENTPEADYTYFYTDPIAVWQSQTYFNSFFKDSRPLYEHYTAEKVPALLDKIELAAEQPQNSYWFTTQPLTCAHKPTLLSVLSFLADEEDLSLEHFAHYEKIQKKILQNLQNNFCRVILNMDLLEESCRPEFLKLHAATEDYIYSVYQGIQHLLYLLETYPSFEIGLTRDTPINMQDGYCLFVKEKTITMVNSYYPNSLTPLTLLNQEPTIVDAYYLHLNNFWQQIPPINRERNWVREKLAKWLEKLASNLPTQN